VSYIFIISYAYFFKLLVYVIVMYSCVLHSFLLVYLRVLILRDNLHEITEYLPLTDRLVGII